MEWLLRTRMSDTRTLPLGIGSVLVASLLLASCSQVTTPPPVSISASARPNADWRPKTPLPRETLSESEAAGIRKDYLAAQAKQLGVDAGTAPALVRWIFPDQIGAVHSACMAERGFTVTPSSGGTGVRGSVPPSQQAAYNQALFECEALYTVDARAMRPPSPALLGAAYDYTVEWLIPCLARNGHPNVQPPSSRATYIASGGDWEAYPYSDDAVQERCPVQPPNAVVFGE